MKNHNLLVALILMLAFIMGCQKEPLPVNEEEVITTVVLSLLKSGETTPVNYAFNDPDGDGGLMPTIDSVIIDKNSAYTAQLILINQLATPVDTISNEIQDEADEHQFFYQSTPTDLLSPFTYLDFDGNGKPLGLSFQFNTKNASETGSLKITLRHLPAKSAPGVSSGDITNAGGETDIEITFPVRLK